MLDFIFIAMNVAAVGMNIAGWWRFTHSVDPASVRWQRRVAGVGLLANSAAIAGPWTLAAFYAMSPTTVGLRSSVAVDIFLALATISVFCAVLSESSIRFLLIGATALAVSVWFFLVPFSGFL